MNDEKKPKNSLAVKADRFEGGYAVLRLSDGQEIFWPKNQIPQDIKLGEKIYLLIRSLEETKIDNQDLAKNILEQILNGKRES